MPYDAINYIKNVAMFLHWLRSDAGKGQDTLPQADLEPRTRLSPAIHRKLPRQSSSLRLKSKFVT